MIALFPTSNPVLSYQRAGLYISGRVICINWSMNFEFLELPNADSV